jgi:T5orf172 domain-containing protein
MPPANSASQIPAQLAVRMYHQIVAHSPKRLFRNGEEVSYRDRKVGHVYILINPAMPGLVKIGRTRDQTKARARQLYSTGVPTEFVVLWQELVHDSEEVEKEIHERFEASRVNLKREFFEVEPQEAIRTLIEVARAYRFDLSAESSRVPVLEQLRAKFGSDLRPDIVAVNVAEDEVGTMFLEVIRVPVDRKTKKQYVDYVDLNVLGEGFTFYQSLDAVAKKVIGLDPVSIAAVTDLLKDEVARRLWEKHLRERAGADTHGYNESTEN